MDSCDRYQAQMLEYLYGLPEEDELRAFEEHLESCSTCPVLLREAREQQRLLAAAARLTFPGVRFEVPADTASTGPRLLSISKEPVRTRWLPWAVAAALLLALGGLSVPLVRNWKTADQQLGKANGKENEGSPATSKTTDGTPSMQEPRRFVPASVQEISAWVELLAVDPENRTIEVRTRRGEKRKLTVGVNAQIVLLEAKAALADLRPGQSLLLTVDQNGKGQWVNLKRIEDEATAKAAGKP